MQAHATKQAVTAKAFQSPEQALIALIIVQIAFWTLAPALSHSAPPLDVVEMYAWGREGVVATFKHPNLPGLVLEATRRLTGIAGWPAYLVSQAFICATFALVFLLGRELMDARRALGGTLLLTGVYFFSWPGPEFNHNVAQMPLWALIAWTLWRGTTRGDLWAWALLGLAGGFGLWAKYSSGVLLLLAAAWILWDPRARKSLLTLGPYLALLLFGVSAAPQALWLFAHDFQPFAYAARRSANEAHWYGGLEFLATQALHHLPMLIVMWCAGLFGRKTEDGQERPGQREMRFLLLIGVGPVLLTALGATLAGAGLKSAWAAPMLNLSGLLAVALLSSRLNDARLGRVIWGAGVLIVLVSTLYFAHMRFGAALTDKPLKGNWPQAEMSAGLEQIWAENTGGAPLKIVAGDIWTAGLVGMSDAQPPSVLINGDLSISPWISAEELARDGALIVWPDGAEPPEALNLDTSDNAPSMSSLTVPFARFPDAPPLVIHYQIIPPSASEDVSLSGD